MRAVALALAREVATHEALTHNAARGTARVSVALVNKREDTVVDDRGRQRREGSPGAAACSKDATIAVRLTTNTCQGRGRPARLEIKLVRRQPVDSVRISCMGFASCVAGWQARLAAVEIALSCTGSTHCQTPRHHRALWRACYALPPVI